MAIVDYDKKMEIIEDFYSQATELVRIVQDSIKGFHYVNGYNLLEEFDGEKEKAHFELFGYSKRNEIETRKKQLLIELGRAGEYAIKYLLLLKQMEEYPNQTIEEFKKKAIYSIGEKGVGNTYINQYHIDSSIVDDIRDEKEKHNLQPLHDYSYLFYILKRLYPDISDKVYESFILDITSQKIENSKIDKNIKEIMLCFPQCEWMASNLLDFDIQPYINEYDRIRNESGDSFVRLRYIENNEDNKQYNLESVLYYLEYLSFHLELVHYANNNINGNISLEYSKSRLMNIADIYVAKKLKEEDPKRSPLALRGKYIDYFKEEYKNVDEVFKIIEKNYDSIMKSFNYMQVNLYEKLSGNKLTFIDMYENIMKNIKTFERYPQLFGKIPLLIDVQNNIEVLKTLKSNGLDINNVQDIDQRVFCVPVETLNRICGYINRNGEELIVDNKINDKFFKYVETERIINEEGMDSNGLMPLPLRTK